MKRTLRYTSALATALVLLLLAGGCTNELPPDPLQEETPVAVAFDVYMGNTAETRAGKTGVINTDNILGYGFGVYAYYTGSNDLTEYSQFTDFVGEGLFPNYMYNQEVAWKVERTYNEDEGKEEVSKQGWEYSPVKYWPNGNGQADDTTGQGKTQHKVSFFAYAPYVELTDYGTNKNDDDNPADTDNGIVAINGGAANAPVITYKLAADPANQVDLLYANNHTNETKQAVGDRLTFDFHHALSCIEVYVQRVYNKIDPEEAELKSAATKIFVSEFSIAGSGLAAEGKFSLQTGQWANVSGSLTSTPTITSDDIDRSLRGTTEPNTTVTDGTTATNPLVQRVELDCFDKYDDNTKHPGVTGTEQPLGNRVVMFIPPSGEMSIIPTLKYNFVTHDDDLRLSLTGGDGTSHYGRIQNTVTATSGVDFTVEPGKKYKLLCRIGVESMEFGVSSVDFELIGVEDWDFPMRFHPSVDDFVKGGGGTVKVGGEEPYD